MKILLQFTRQKPQMELPRTPSPLTMLRTQVLIVFTCVVQFSWGVKKTPRYCMDVAGLIEISVSSGSCRVMVAGGELSLLSCDDCRVDGWKNMTSHLSRSIENPEFLSQEKMSRAARESLAAVAMKVGPDAKILLLLT
jgi:hypothetical protein